jgi:hypothetical protein
LHEQRKFAGVTLLRGGTGTARLERVAALTISDIEVIRDHGKHHRVGAKEQLPVFDRLEVHVGHDVRGAMAVPAKFMAKFRLEAQWTGHRGGVYDQLDRR